VDIQPAGPHDGTVLVRYGENAVELVLHDEVIRELVAKANAHLERRAAEQTPIVTVACSCGCGERIVEGQECYQSQSGEVFAFMPCVRRYYGVRYDHWQGGSAATEISGGAE